MTYDEALNIIIKKQSLGIKPGLNRIKALLSLMDNPQDKLKIIHIAGTNGKGTVAKTVADALQLNGLKVGLFSSPWIVDYREQLQINSEYIPENVFAEYVSLYSNNDCTEFELLTAIMYKYFADCGVDYAVVECGMGGREDATNVEKRNLAVITAVSLDHTDFLGNKVEEIAAEKSGVLRKECACILYPNKGLENIFRDKCKKLVCVEEQGGIRNNNLATVNAVLSELGFDAVSSLSLIPARLERLNGILLDGGHNPSAAETLAPVINNEVALIGMMSDKDVRTYLSLIAPKCKRIIAVKPNNSRAMSAEDLAKIAAEFCDDVRISQSPETAVRDNRDITLICGSFYLIRQIRKLIV